MCSSGMACFPYANVAYLASTILRRFFPCPMSIALKWRMHACDPVTNSNNDVINKHLIGRYWVISFIVFRLF